MRALIFFFCILYSLNSHSFSKCVPANQRFSKLEGFREQEQKLACTPVKVGDVIDTCNGEVCGYLSYPKAINDVKLHARPDLKSPIVGQVKKCQKIENFKVVSIFREFGELEALTELEGYGLKKGDKVKYLWSKEGNYYGCLKNRPIVIYAYGERDLAKTCFFQIKPSLLEEWVHHKASNGKMGYSIADSENRFYIPYGGWDQSLICEEDRNDKEL